MNIVCTEKFKCFNVLNKGFHGGGGGAQIIFSLTKGIGMTHDTFEDDTSSIKLLIKHASNMLIVAYCLFKFSSDTSV